MIFLWFLLLLGWPVAEIWVFIEVGHAIGWLNAVLLTFATSIAGTALMRIQGLSAINQFLRGAERGELPVGTVLDGMGIFIAGLLLLTPGFLSDAVGLLLFIPPVRRVLTAWLFRQMPGSPISRDRVKPGGGGGRPSGSGKDGLRKSENVVDAEFETIDPGPRKPIPPREKRNSESSS